MTTRSELREIIKVACYAFLVSCTQKSADRCFDRALDEILGRWYLDPYERVADVKKAEEEAWEEYIEQDGRELI